MQRKLFKRTDIHTSTTGAAKRFFSRRRIILCQRTLIVVLVALVFLAFFAGELDRISLDTSSANIKSDSSVHKVQNVSHDQQNAQFSKDFVVIPNKILRMNWQRKKNKGVFLLQSFNNSQMINNSSKLKLDSKNPGLILYRPQSEVKYNPFLALSASQIENRRARLSKYLDILEEKFTPKPTGNEYINFTLVEELPTKLLLSKQHGPIITLFTTFKHKEDNITLKMNKNLLMYWGTLKPWVDLILFLDSADFSSFEASGMKKLADSQGWKIVKIGRTVHKLPLVKDMYKTAISLSNASVPFVAYANADIIFDMDLIETLVFIWKVWSKFITEKGCLFVGKRTPVSLNKFEDTMLPEKFNKTRNYNFKKSLIKDADYSFDYFITTRTGFKWDQTPDFVVGKPGYDAWLVIMAQEWDLVTIDLTNSVTAYHIIIGRNLFPEQGWMAGDVCMNRVLVDPFDYKRAHTHCAKYFTIDASSPNSSFMLDSNNTFTKQAGISTMQIYKRKSLQDVCYINTDKSVREEAKRHYPTCKETAEIKRSKYTHYKHVAALVNAADLQLLKMGKNLPMSNRNVYRIIR